MRGDKQNEELAKWGLLSPDGVLDIALGSSTWSEVNYGIISWRASKKRSTASRAGRRNSGSPTERYTAHLFGRPSRPSTTHHPRRTDRGLAFRNHPSVSMMMQEMASQLVFVLLACLNIAGATGHKVLDPVHQHLHLHRRADPVPSPRQSRHESAVNSSVLGYRALPGPTNLYRADSLAMLTSACANALSAPLDCTSAIREQPYLYTWGGITATELSELCTSGCTASVNSYRSSVLSACSGDIWYVPLIAHISHVQDHHPLLAKKC
jgi:hypothetical protein